MSLTIKDLIHIIYITCICMHIFFFMSLSPCVLLFQVLSCLHVHVVSYPYVASVSILHRLQPQQVQILQCLQKIEVEEEVGKVERREDKVRVENFWCATSGRWKTTQRPRQEEEAGEDKSGRMREATVFLGKFLKGYMWF